MPKKAQELKPDDPEFLPVQYDLTQERLNQLAVDYDPELIPNAEKKGDDAYAEIHNKVMAIAKVRTNIEKVRKELKADALAWGRKVDGEAKRLTEQVEKLEEPWRAVKAELDEREAREAEEARQAEVARIEAIESRIADIRSKTEGLINATAAEIQARISEVNTIVISELDFEDYTEGAQIIRQTVLDTLNTAFSERAALETQQAELKRQQAELAESQRKVKEEQKALDEQKAAQEAAERAQREEQERQEREKQEAEAAAKREALLKKRLPEDQKVRQYMGALVDMKQPKVKDPELQCVLAEINSELIRLKNFVDANTQEKN